MFCCTTEKKEQRQIARKQLEPLWMWHSNRESSHVTFRNWRDRLKITTSLSYQHSDLTCGSYVAVRVEESGHRRRVRILGLFWFARRGAWAVRLARSRPAELFVRMHRPHAGDWPGYYQQFLLRPHRAFSGLRLARLILPGRYWTPPSTPDSRP